MKIQIAEPHPRSGAEAKFPSDAVALIQGRDFEHHGPRSFTMPRSHKYLR